MKKSFILSSLVLALITASLLLSRGCQHSRAAKASITADTRARLQPPAPVASGNARARSSAQEKSDVRRDPALDALALSGFLPNSAVRSLDPDTAARLEIYLQDVRKITYQLMVESGTVSRFPDGRIHIEIAGESRRANELKDQVYSSIENIVGTNAMKQMKESLGLRLDAKFAYFGQYDTAIDLSIDRTPNSNEYVTMASAYKQVKLLGFATANIRSTSTDSKDGFESRFFSLSTLRPTPNGD